MLSKNRATYQSGYGAGGTTSDCAKAALRQYQLKGIDFCKIPCTTEQRAHFAAKVTKVKEIESEARNTPAGEGPEEIIIVDVIVRNDDGEWEFEQIINTDEVDNSELLGRNVMYRTNVALRV